MGTQAFDGWFECARPAVRNKWQKVVMDFMDSGSECWCRKFENGARAHEASKALRTAARVLRGRGVAADVAVTKRERCVYIARLTGGDGV